MVIGLFDFPLQKKCSRMSGALRLSALAAALIYMTPAPVLAQIDDKHQRLMTMTVEGISAELQSGSADQGALGHVFLRCAIISDVMAQMIPAASTDGMPDETRAEMERIAATYKENWLMFLTRGSEAVDLPEDKAIELNKVMFETWATALTQSAAQLFRKNEEGSTPWRAGQAFLSELNICNATAQQL